MEVKRHGQSDCPATLNPAAINDLSGADNAAPIRFALEAAQLGVWQWDADTNQLTSSQAVAALIGRPAIPGGVDCEAFLAAVHADDRQRVAEALDIKTAEPAHCNLEFRVVWPDGSIHWVESRGVVEVDDAGHARHFTYVMADVTKRKQTEAALQESRKRHRALFEANPHPMWVFDVESLRILEANNAAADHYHYSRAEFLNLTCRELFAEEEIPRFAEFLANAPAHHAAGGVWKHRTKGGARLEVELASQLVRHGKRAARLVLAVDVTERNRAEAALRDREAFLRAVFDAEPECVNVVDADGTLLTVNPAGLAMLEARGAETVVGRSFFDLIAPDHREAYRAFHEQVCFGGKGRLQFEMITADGNRRWMESHAVALPHGPERTAAKLEIIRDITERKRIEVALQESEGRLRSILHYAQEAIISADNQGRIVGWNRGAEVTFGYKEEEVLGRPLSLLMPERYRAIHEQSLERLRDAGQVRLLGTTRELHGLRKDGSEFPLELSLAMWAMGNELFFTGIIRDSTQRKRLEESFVQAQRMEVVGRLAGGVAHDFNNLLTLIQGYTEIIAGNLLPSDPLRECVEQIQQAGARAESLTRQLLAFSRKQVLKAEVIDLNFVVHNMDRMLRRLIGEDIELVSDLDTDLRRVKADPRQLEQVIMNLAVNARDAMPHGGRLEITTVNVNLDRSIRASGGDEIPPGEYVVLAMRDSGSGMDDAVKAHLFEPFFTTKEKGKGTGLGLATVHGIVKQSDGFIDVGSSQNQGTVFQIYLPAVSAPVETSPLPEKEAALQSGCETILLVEDEDRLRTMASMILRQQGYRVIEAPNGEEAIRLCADFPDRIHLLLTDVIMPGMSGPRVAEQLTKARQELKVLYMSGYTDDAILHHGLADSTIAFLQKPFTKNGLARKVREVMEEIG